jgi:hypothetical protein
MFTRVPRSAQSRYAGAMMRMPWFLAGIVCFAGCDEGAVATPDGGGGGSDASTACPDPTIALPNDWRPIDAVSAGTVRSTPAGDRTTTSIDASAGGFGASANEPYVYIAFDGANADKVAITDVQSYADGGWDLALKRHVIRANGGDSGPGGVRVARVSAASLDAVTAAPGIDQFATDDWATDACVFVPDQIAAPLTAIGSWFSAAAGELTPQPFVYVVDLGGGTLLKLRVVTYKGDPLDADKTAFYQVEWAAL